MKLKYDNFYIYGIIVDNKLVYIGKTRRTLRERILEHLTLDNNNNKKLYKIFEQEDFNIVIMFDNSKKEIGNDIELQSIEEYLIDYYKPECNKEGVIKQYQYR